MPKEQTHDSIFMEINGHKRKTLDIKRISDWKRVEISEIDSDYWSIANQSKNEWGVVEKGGIIYSVLLERSPKPKISINVDDGEIISNDMGEFGARVYWESSYQSTSKIINYSHISSFIKTPIGILGRGGLSHMCLCNGEIVKFFKKNDLWTSETVIAFHDTCPYAWCLHDNNLWIVTDSGLLNYSIYDLRLEMKIKEFWELLYPNSIVIDSNNTVFIGMRDGIVEIKNSCKIYWLIEKEEKLTEINELVKKFKEEGYNFLFNRAMEFLEKQN